MMGQVRVEFDVPAVMRDGTVLKANIFRPDDDGTFPVAVARTPYGKDLFTSGSFLDAVRLARAGYIVIIQDVRGRFASAGEWRPFVHEGADGFDTVEWAAQLPGSNGRVGMCGMSYLGFTQWAAAMQNPPHLKAIVPAITWADLRDGVAWRGGAMELGTSAYWSLGGAFDTLFKRHAGKPSELGPRVESLVSEFNRLPDEGYASLPLQGFEPLTQHNIAPDFQESILQPNSREYNKPYSAAEFYDQVKVPAFNIGGWYDVYLQGTLQNFRALRASGSTPEVRQSKVLIGPWTHTHNSYVVGQVDFGFKAQMSWINLQSDVTGLTQRWFDYWLKGIENGVTSEPPVKLFIMGDNVWRDEQEWPLARTRYTPFYLHSGGELSMQPPDSEPADHYTYDPANPAPTTGGAVLLHPQFADGPRDQRPIEQRDDVLVYTSEPLAEDTEVTGPVIVKLWACSDAPDTDFVARIVDVHPDGFAQTITDGIIRARYRNGDAPEMLQPGQAYEFTINLWSTANVFKAGHRIRLDITSSNFPRWDRNPNTGAPFGSDTERRPAHQTILHDAEHPSHVILPLIPR
jgi:uncharacterized protein